MGSDRCLKEIAMATSPPYSASLQVRDLPECCRPNILRPVVLSCRLHQGDYIDLLPAISTKRCKNASNLECRGREYKNMNSLTSNSSVMALWEESIWDFPWFLPRTYSHYEIRCLYAVIPWREAQISTAVLAPVVPLIIAPAKVSNLRILTLRLQLSLDRGPRTCSGIGFYLESYEISSFVIHDVTPTNDSTSFENLISAALSRSRVL